MKKIIDTSDLYEIAEDILRQVEFLELLDDNEGDEIGYFTPELRQAAEDLKELAETSEAAPAHQGGNS